jgi:hypothetical protein
MSVGVIALCSGEVHGGCSLVYGAIFEGFRHPLCVWMAHAVRVSPGCSSMLPVCIRCDMVYFNLVCAVSSRILLYAHGPGGESRDVNDYKQQLMSAARPLEAASENRQRGRRIGYLLMWRVWRHWGH